MSAPLKALLVDDHPLILAALKSVVEGMGAPYRVVGVGSASAAREALAADSSFDLVLLDLNLGDANGFDLLVELRRAYPALPVVVLSASDRSSDVIRAIDLGAMGFVPKRASNEALFEALRTVMMGRIYVPPMSLRSNPKFDEQDGAAAPAGDVNAPPPRLDGVRSPLAGLTPAKLKITPRQFDVLALLLRGQSNKLIARELNVSLETVKDHVAAVLRALNVNSRTQAVLAVSQMHEPGSVPQWRRPD
ncbi:response regulator [Piscinibacter koreensis]|uniref:Response regulator transcription factor n=1 Tax=Piscinibacter koreensis TaxID=2742824 RepID=A0A7Y6NPL0_9BURK|nr:response regulator transcription factor [Schlegelella koreensis]NUZ06869.1 response regulator transcription factor [Schlegelella koreensis]